jgi:hypothetical protein
MTYIISHRGNLKGPEPTFENKISFLKDALSRGYYIEIDVRVKDENFYLGHDDPKEMLGSFLDFSSEENIYIHCKDIRSFLMMREYYPKSIIFSHNTDNAVLTSNRKLWIHPKTLPYLFEEFQAGKLENHLISNAIAVLPESQKLWYNVDAIKFLRKFWGICTDHPIDYEDQLENF